MLEKLGPPYQFSAVQSESVFEKIAELSNLCFTGLTDQ